VGDKKYKIPKTLGNYTYANFGRRRNVAVWLVWITWLTNQFICVVLLLNFLVSYVGEIYGKVTAAQSAYSYRQKAELNSEFYSIVDFFGANKPF
jgi:hypothetical protein